MMNQLQIFNNEEFGEMRTIVLDGEPMFNLDDVSFALGYTRVVDNKLYLRKDRIEKVLENGLISTFVHDGTKYINEEGIYEFMFESRTEKSRSFRQWVTSTVIPTLRKTGSFDIVEQKLKSIEDETERDLSIGLYSIEKALELNPNDIGLAISYNKNKADLDMYLQNRRLETLQDEVESTRNRVELVNEKVDSITMVGNRASFNAEVKSIAKSSGASHSEIYGLIYKRMKDAYSVDVIARSQNLKKQIQDDRIKLGKKPYQESTMKGKGQPVDIIERDYLWHEASQCLNSVKLDLKQEVVF